eukprot:7450965-Prorocentrum_lima.AAC.1
MDAKSALDAWAAGPAASLDRRLAPARVFGGLEDYAARRIANKDLAARTAIVRSALSQWAQRKGERPTLDVRALLFGACL